MKAFDLTCMFQLQKYILQKFLTALHDINTF